MPIVDVQGNNVVQVCLICGAEKTVAISALRPDKTKDDPDPSVFTAPICGVNGCLAQEGFSWHDDTYSKVVEESLGLLDYDDLDQDGDPKVKWVSAHRVEPNPDDFRARHMEHIATVAVKLGRQKAKVDQSPEWFAYDRKPIPLDHASMGEWRKQMQADARFRSSEMNPKNKPKK